MHVFRFSAQARPPSQSDETRSFHRNLIPILVNLIRQPHPVIPASQRSRQPSQSDSDSWSLLNKRPLRCLFRLLRCFVLPGLVAIVMLAFGYKYRGNVPVLIHMLSGQVGAKKAP